MKQFQIFEYICVDLFTGSKWPHVIENVSRAGLKGPLYQYLDVMKVDGISVIM
jgi:hypothetical protein